MIKRIYTHKISIFLILFISIILYIFLSHSTLLPSYESYMHIDSQVYIYAGKQILNGKILYRDFFDHKGPMMYIFEVVGLFVYQKNFIGIWLVQYLFLVCSIAPLIIFFAKKYSFLQASVALLFLFAWLSRTTTISDNIPELYAVGFVSLIYFFYFKLLYSTVNIKWNSFFIAFFSTCLFLLKPNFVILVLAFIFHLYYYKFSSPFFKPIFIYNALGVLLISIPIILYFFYNHALYDFYFSVYTFNFSYIASQKLSVLQSMIDAIFLYPNTVFKFIFTLLICAIFILEKIRKQLLLLGFTFFISVVLLVGMPGRGIDSVHYLMPFAPLIACIVIAISSQFNKYQIFLLFMISCFFCKPIFLSILEKKTERKAENKIVEYLNNHKKGNETLCILGNQSKIYWLTNIPCNSPYFFTYPILQSSKSILYNRFINDFEKQKPTWIVYEKYNYFENNMLKILDNYQRVFSEKNTDLYHIVTN